MDKPAHPDARPVAPECPHSDDCCRSGCDPCVFDLYNEALARYRQALQEWEQRQSGKPPADAAK